MSNSFVLFLHVSVSLHTSQLSLVSCSEFERWCRHGQHLLHYANWHEASFLSAALPVEKWIAACLAAVEEFSLLPIAGPHFLCQWDIDMFSDEAIQQISCWAPVDTGFSNVLTIFFFFLGGVICDSDSREVTGNERRESRGIWTVDVAIKWSSSYLNPEATKPHGFMHKFK